MFYCRGLSVTQEEIYEVVRKLSTSLRDGTTDFLRTLNQYDVPILVFSAGLGDTIRCVLRHYDVLLPNVKVILFPLTLWKIKNISLLQVVSNFIKYDENGTIVGFQGPLIHVLNKNEFAIKNSEFYDLVKNRSNVILLGDSLGDAKMADGMDHAKHILKIGFIYEKVYVLLI